jgi:preprotein translocase subunit Sec61beta
MPSFSYLLIVLTRALMLGLIVYYATSTIPKTAIDPKNKMIISLIVVILYALIDYFAGFFGMVRTFFCKTTCGCAPPSSGSRNLDLNELSRKLDIDLPSAPSLNLPDGDFDFDFDTASDVSSVKAGLNTDELANEVDEAIKALDKKDATEQLLVEDEEAEEEAAKVAMGLPSAEEEAAAALAGTDPAPVPAESSEGFSNYASW